MGLPVAALARGWSLLARVQIFDHHPRTQQSWAQWQARTAELRLQRAEALPTGTASIGVGHARQWLLGAIAHAGELAVGSGHGPVHHFHALWRPPRPTS